MRLFIAFMLLFILFVSVYAGEDASQHNVSITISPFHLLNPEFHLTGEFRLASKMSVAAMLGAGAVTDEGKTYSIWEAGGQFRYYFLGSFTRGMMLGADVGYVDVNGQMANPMAYYVGARAGGFLGYKIVIKSGFTAEAQYGPVYVRENAENSELQTLINLKVGWSF
ncbi:hypothetical protein A2V82_13850 [candidate division KSB1 bacterium RBG_16_48_16]|nr:MAG: hypothetical protein A2V82_13850 [candidate division KSB1 bacterium RBG_16_48_16]